MLARFIGELRGEDRAFAAGLGIDGAWREEGFLPYSESIRAQRAADALLLLIPHAGGRGDTVLSGKVFEYVAAARPMLAAVPPQRRRGQPAPRRSAPAGWSTADDAERDLGRAGAAGGRLAGRRPGRRRAAAPTCATRLSRASRAGELAAVLRRVAG